MKNTTLLILFIALLTSCGNNKEKPDVSDIKVSIPIERFDKDFFTIDTNDITTGLRNVQAKHPGFYSDFMHEILGVEATNTSWKTQYVTKQFLAGYREIYDTLQKVYKNTDGIQKDLEQSFRYVKYYFPKYQTGKAILFIGPFDAPGVANTREGLAIGLQQYAGRNFSVYQAEPLQEIFPYYITRRFSPEYIVPNCMKAVISEIFPDRSVGKPLIEQMVEKGKEWWLLDKLIPDSPDSLKTGFTQQQLDWCEQNEGFIWTYIIRNEDLYSLSPEVIQTYMGEAPFTQGFNQELSPGNIGQWIGWRIIQKYAKERGEKNPNMKPEDIMTADPKTILDVVKYKPK